MEAVPSKNGDFLVILRFFPPIEWDSVAFHGDLAVSEWDFMRFNGIFHGVFMVIHW